MKVLEHLYSLGNPFTDIVIPLPGLVIILFFFFGNSKKVHGTHDIGSSMYPLGSTNWKGNDCLQCITGKNGITIIDLQLNNNSKHFVGWFLDMNGQVLDDFQKNKNVT